MFNNMIGDRTEGRMERTRLNLGMSVEKFTEFIENQKKAHAELLEAEQRYKKARQAFYESCCVKTRDGE